VEEVDGEQVLQVAWSVRVLQLMSNLWFVMLLAFFYFIIALLINTIVMLGTNGQFLCEFQTVVNLRIVNAVQLIIVYVLTILLLFGDVLGNLKMLSHCEIYNYVFKKDPFYFRVQIALFVPYMLYDLAAELYFLIAIQSFPDLIYTVVQTEALNTVNFDILLLIDVVLPLMLSVFTFIINLFLEEKVEDSEVEKLLGDPQGHQVMLEFLKKSYLIENLYCWDDILKYRSLEKEDLVLMSLKDEVKRRGILGIHAKRIYDKYFNGESSLMEVNVPKRETDIILKLLKQKKANLQIFDEVFYYVRDNLADLYSRLILTTEFIKYQKQKEVEKQLMEKTQRKFGLFRNFWNNVKRKSSFRIRNKSSIVVPNALEIVEKGVTIIQPVELLEVESSSHNVNATCDEIDKVVLPPQRQIITESKRQAKPVIFEDDNDGDGKVTEI